MVAKLRGVEYCPEANIDAAETRSGVSVIASPPCPDNSFVGTTDIAAGSGSAPFKTTGNVYLAGPYKGAPVSMAFVTPAVAGPYDLGTVVVRAALYIDPETAEVHAVSDTIPFIFGGVKLDIRSIDVSINRKNFALNPTTCREPFSIRSSIFGGGANPASEAAWVASSPSSPFRATECSKLKFKPKFFARILGGENQTKRAKNPKFRAILEARNGDANLRRAAFILPRATILDQSHIKTICTRVQLAASECPKNAIYGHAKATSPLLDGKLKGPVYLTSSSHTLPDLLVDLRGQVNDPAARRDQLRARSPQDGVQQHPGRGGGQVHPDHEGRREGAAGQLAQPLLEADERLPQPAGAEQPAAEEEQPAAQHPGLPLRLGGGTDAAPGRASAPAPARSRRRRAK